MFQLTPQKRVLFPRTLTPVMVGGFLASLVLFSLALSIIGTNTANAATNSTLNFQARLENASGNIAPDGNYFIEFNLYTAASGGTSIWTERYQGSAFSCPFGSSTGGANNKVTVKNGYLSVSLGALCSFPATINWDQQLWVTMNIGGSGGTATWDGEMNPRLALTSVPYSFRAGQLAQFNSGNGFSSILQIVQPTSGNQTFQIPDMGAAGTYNVCIANSSACGFALSSGNNNYIQNQISSAQTTSNFWISGTGRAATALQAPLIDAATSSTALDIGTTNASVINLNQNVVVASNKTLTANGNVLLKAATASQTAFQIANTSSTPLINVDSTTLNLVSNSSFEPNIASWSSKVPTAGGGSSTLSQTSSQVFSGFSSLQAITTAANYGVQTSTFTSAITTTTQYEVTFMARCSASIATFTYGHQDVSGGTANDLNASTTANCDTNWRRYTFHFTTGATVTSPNIYMTLGSTSSGTLWVDGVQTLQTNTSGVQPYQPGSVKIDGVITDPLVIRNAFNSTNAFEVQDTTGRSNTLVVDTANNLVNLSALSVGGTPVISSSRVLQNVTADASILTAGTINSARITGNYTGITGVGTLTAGTWNATTINPQYGGTGVNGATAANGTLLIGNGSGYSLATLTAGTGISITNNAGGITIANSGASNFIQNQNTSAQTTANFWISNTGRADTALQAPLIDTATSVALNVGTTNATAINLNQNVTVAAGKTITMVGGITSTRPASPAAGMVYFDTSTGQLLTYTGSKWQAGHDVNSRVVAASNSSQTAKDAADYVASGSGDEATINTALTAAAGGTVYLLEGTYTAGGTILIPNNTVLKGAGMGTLIQFSAINTNDNLIENSDTTTGTGVIVQDLRLDGRSDLNTTGTIDGIHLVGMGGGSGPSARSGAKISNVKMIGFRDDGLELNGSSNNTVTGIVSQGSPSTGAGIFITASSNYNTITGNLVQGNANSGVSISSSSNNNTITGNISQGNTGNGIGISNGTNDTVSGNTVSDNGINGISLAGGSNYTISGNTTQNNTQWGILFNTGATKSTASSNMATGNGGTTYGGIGLFASSSENTITGNTAVANNVGIFLNNSVKSAITGNTTNDNVLDGILLTNNANDNSITGNTSSNNGESGIQVDTGVSNIMVSGNRIADNYGTTFNDGILVNGTNDSVVGNNITDSSATTANRAILINSAASGTYLADNLLGGAIVSDSGTNTIYSNQTNANGVLQTRSSGGTEIQATIYSDLLTATPITSTNLLINPGLDVFATGYFTLGTGTSGTITTTAANVQSGSGALAMTLGTSATNGVQIGATGITGGTLAIGTYTLSFYAKSSATLSGLAAVFSGGGTCTLSSTTVSTAGYQRYTCTVTTTAASTTINITSTTPSQTLYIDSVQLQSGNTASPYTVGTINVSGVIASDAVFQNSANSTTAFQVQNSAGTGFINIDTTNSAVTVGSLTGSTTTLIQGGNGTNAVSIAAASGGTIAIGSTGVTNTINIGNTGASTAVSQTINIGTNTNASGSTQINIGAVNNVSDTVSINGGTGANAINMNVGASGTIGLSTNGFANTTIQIGNTSGAVTQTVNVGNNATASSTNNVTVGSLIGTSKTTIQSGSNDINLVTNQTTAGTTIQNTSAAGSATAFLVQDANATAIFGVDTASSSADLIGNNGFELNTSGWSNKGTGALTRTTTAAAIYAGSAAGQLVMNSATNNGASFAVATTLGQTYYLRFWVRASSGTVTNLASGYTNGSGDHNCVTGGTVPSTGFTPYDCTFSPTTTAGTSIYIKETSAVAETLYIDSVFLGLSTTGVQAQFDGKIKVDAAFSQHVVFQNDNDSWEAFAINGSDGGSMLWVDTLNKQIHIPAIVDFRNTTTITVPTATATTSGTFSVGNGTSTESLYFNPGMFWNGTAMQTGPNVFNLDISGNSTLNISDNITTSGVVCIATLSCTHALGVNGQGFANGGFFTGTPDIAEYITAAPGVQTYDVVAADPNNDEQVVKATKSTRGAMVGAISDGTSGFQMMNAHYGQAFDANTDVTDPNAKPMTLAGRIPLHVTNENGPIHPGDYLTISSTPGYAMKATTAGATIGKALGNFDASSGTVLTLINLSYFDPNDGNNIQAQTGSFDTLQAGTASFNSLNVSGRAKIAGLTVTGDAEIQGDMTVSGRTPVAGINVNGHIVLGGSAPAVLVGIASGQPKIVSGAPDMSTTPTVAVDGNDSAGTITLTTGYAGLSNGVLAHLTFSSSFETAFKVVITATNSPASKAEAYVTKTANGFDLTTDATLTPATQYQFDYIVLGSQTASGP
jgi:parallel beta-helix repeat protein